MPFSPAQRKLQAWQSSPASVRPRGLKTEKQISKKMGIPISTLRMWELLPGWWDDVFIDARAIIGRELGGILDAMVRRAKGGSVPAAKLCLAALDVHVDKLRIEGEIKGEQLVLIMPAEQHKKEIAG